LTKQKRAVTILTKFPKIGGFSMVDVLKEAKKTKKTVSSNGKVRVAFDLTDTEHAKVVQFCVSNDLSIGKLARVLLLDFIEKQQQNTEKKERK